MIKKISTFFLLNGIVFAQATSEEIKEVLSRNTYEPNYFSMILGLFVVVAMIYVTGFLYQKLTKINMKPKDAFLNKAQIISTTSLGQGRNLHVVKIGNEACLIGSTQNNITYIKDIKLADVDKNEDLTNGKSS